MAAFLLVLLLLAPLPGRECDRLDEEADRSYEAAVRHWYEPSTQRAPYLEEMVRSAAHARPCTDAGSAREAELVKRQAAGLLALGRNAELLRTVDAFLAAGEASLKSRPEDHRDRDLRAMREKIGDLTMTNELLEAKIDRLETGAPFARRRSRR